MHLLKILLFSIFVLYPALSLHGDTQTIHISPQKEIEILKSLDIDPSFREDIHYIQTKENINKLKKLFFLKTLKRGSIFIPNLHALLDEADIPDTFLYMAMVESKFLADSKSHKHAAGLWQFMPATAREYKLSRTRHIDERLDPIKSTEAAIEYLKYLHRRFHKWYLAAMAYNCGETRLAQAIKKAGTDNLAVLLDEDEGYLPKETRDYIQRIIVAALLAHDKNIIKQNNSNHLFGYCSNKKLIKLYFKGGQSLQTIAVKIGVPYQKLRACNPQLIKKRLPPNSNKLYYLYLPEDLAQKAKKRIATSGETFIYHVQPNDTLFLISKRFNVKMSALKALNPHLSKYKVLKIGMPLTILGKPPQDQKGSQKSSSANILKNRIVTYTPEANTTLFALSKKFNNKVALLKKLNPGITEKIHKGQKIKVVRDLNISTTEHNITKGFKTALIASKDNSSTPSTSTQTVQKEQNNRRFETPAANVAPTPKSTLSEASPQPAPPVYRSYTHRLEQNETFASIAAEFNLTVKDLLKAGNVMIFKIKNEQNPDRKNEDRNSTHLPEAKKKP